MRSQGRPSSTVLACSWQLAAGGLRYTTLSLVDAPLPHDLVGDLIPLGLLSHTLHSSSAVPRPRVHLRLGVELRN